LRVFLLAALVLALLAPPTVDARGPAAPNDVFAVRGSEGQIALVWTPAEYATYYVVYRGETPTELHPIAWVATSYFIDPAPQPGVSWYGVASSDGVHTSTPHNVNTGRDGEACVTHNGSGVSVNAQGCTNPGGV